MGNSAAGGGVTQGVNILGGMYASAGGIVGGGKDKSGLDLVEDYANSVYSKAKKELILKLAGAAAVAMQMGKRSFSDIEEAVDFLAKNVPNPKKGEKVKPGAGIHRKVCEALAVEINAAYGTKLISADSNERVCNEVAEVVHSLIRGLHMEFAGVAADVDQVSKNLMILLQYLEQNHMKYNEIISASNDPEIKASSEIVTKFYEKLIDEVKRQLAVLNNIVGNVIGPVGKDLVALVEQSDSFKGMVENIKNELGTKEFGEKLGYVLSGVSDSAQAAKIVEKALAEVGMSVAEYRNTKGVEDLKNKIFEALGRSGKQLGGEEIVKFVKAADVLYRYDFRQPQILEYLKKAGGEDGGADTKPSDEPVEIAVSGGGCGCEGADGGRPNFGVVGGQGEDAAHIFERKTDLKQSLAVKSRELNRFREELFGDFEKSLLTHYRNVVGIIAQIGPKLGTEIPIDENVRAFVRHFGTMDSTNRSNIALALSGYNKSGASLASRNRFIADFAKLLMLAAPLASKSSLFKNLENEIKELNNLIDIFGEKFVKAIQSPLNPRVKGPYAKGGEDGGAYGGDVDGGDFVPSNVSTGNAEKYASFKKAKLQLSYYMAIANIKRSMARAATDDIGTDEAYKSMMGQSVALMIKSESVKMKEINERLDAMLKAPAGLYSVKTPVGKGLVEKTRELAKRQFTAKKELLECAQNIDLYLRAFTSDAVAKPDSLIKLSGVLQQFVNIRKFYTKTAGDNLVELFEQFPRPAGAPAHVEGKDYITETLHQNGAVASNHRSPLPAPGVALDAAALIALGLNAGDAAATVAANGENKLDQNSEKIVDKFTKKLDDAVYGVRALENILLAFAQIGNEQTDKTFMSHGKVLKVLSDYIAASAYSIRAKATGAPVPDIDDKLALTDDTVIYQDDLKNAAGAALIGSDEKNAANPNQILQIVLNQLHCGRAGALNAAAVTAAAVTNDNGGYVDDFKETNKVFEYILKAICGKILTVLGLYSIYNMPNADYMSISAVRTILGGGAEKPVVIPEALELYIRLPLLAEWLRTSFVNVDAGNAMAAANNYAIAMIPDTTSPWSEFLKIFLIKTTHIVDGNYSESDVYAIVSEINKIYTAYREKSPEDTAYAAMEGLVKDFNSRYGIMKTTEVKKYMDKYRSQDDYSVLDAKGKDEDFNNFDLLDSKNARSSGAAPSDRYLEISTLTTSSGTEWTTESAELIKRLHYNIASKFKASYTAVMGNTNINDAVNITNTIHGVVEQYRYELAAASSNDDKVKVVAKAIQSVGMYSNQNPSKFFMFHEMVVSPLYSLFRLYQVLRQFIASYDALTRLVTFPGAGAQPVLTLGAGAGAATIYRDAARQVAGNNPVANITEIEEVVIRSVVVYDSDREAAGFDNANPRVSLRKLLRFQLSLLTTIKTAFGDLVSVSVGGSEGFRYPVVDLNNAKDFSGIVLENVKKALSSLRAFMPPTVIQQFEDVKNYGSVFWLQSHMMDQLFGNNTDAEPEINIKPVNNKLKALFVGTLTAIQNPVNAGHAFEAVYDLCYWRMGDNALIANDLRGVGNRMLPFPANVIDLVDDMDPAKGSIEKQTMEKKYSGIFAGYLKAISGVVERKTANDEATTGRMGMIGRNRPPRQAAGDVDTLAGFKRNNIQDGTAFANKNYLELRKSFEILNREAARLNGVTPGSFAGDAAPGGIILGTFNLVHGVTDAQAEGKTFAEVAIMEYNAAVRDAVIAACAAPNNIAGFDAALTAAIAGALAGDASLVAMLGFAGNRVNVSWLAVCSAVLSLLKAAPLNLDAAHLAPIIAYMKHLVFGIGAGPTAVLQATATGAAGSAAGTLLMEQVLAHYTAAPANAETTAVFGALAHPLVNGLPAVPAAISAADLASVQAANVINNLAELLPIADASNPAYLNDNIANVAGAPGPANTSQAVSQFFLNNHPQIGPSYQTALAIINRIPALGLNQEMKLQVSKEAKAFVDTADLAIGDYERIATGGEQDLVGSNTTLIFNILKMNEGFENNDQGNIKAFGIVPMFNRTLQRYMDTFFDKLAAKFYTPLIEEFATGHFSPAIINKQAYNDTNMLNEAGSAGIGLVKPGVVIASSNARGIRIILNKRDEKGVAKMYALNSLADVSPQMKETMRANLPLFRSAFRDLYDQAEILKKLIITTSVKDEIKYNAAAIARAAPVPDAKFRDQSAEKYLDARAAHPELKINYFKQALEQVQLGCEVLVKCANQVYKELNDAPLFGETYNGSLTEFKQKAKVYPVTPVSIAQHYIEQKLMPGHSNGSDQFKLVYALRGFGDFQISKAPGYEELLRMYNITVPDAAKMNPKYYEEYTKTHVPLLQALIRLNGPVNTFNDNSNMLGGLFSGDFELNMAQIAPAAGVLTNYPLKPYVVARPADPADPVGMPEITPVAIRDELVSLLTNTDVEYERQRFTDLYARNPAGMVGNAGNERGQIQYRNLIETGIVPININALQREIPLANLLNYSYTFEKYVIDSLGVDLPAAGVGTIVNPAYPAPPTTKTLMAYSLVYPYGIVSADAFNLIDPVTSYNTMLAGTGPQVGKIRLERPKFISDQIWNKLCIRAMNGSGAVGLGGGNQVAHITPAGAAVVGVELKNPAENQAIGKRRFDTVLIRNLVWTVQLQRFLTWSIKEKTRKVVNPVSQGDDAYDPSAVEFYGNEGVETYPL